MLTPNTLVRNRYLIARQVSGDRAGAIYETIDLQSRAPIVLKQVLIAGEGGAAADLPRRAEVDRAAQALAGLRHPSLPVVRDYFVEGESAFLTTELVPGEDLATVLDRDGSPFPVERVLRWAGQLLDALDYIHTLQPPLIHGDIRPQNLKLKLGDQVVLLGFGLVRGAPLARQAAADTGGAPPSASCVPPEQARGARADERGDLFALAATLYYLLTRVPPVPAEERARLVARGLPDPLPALHTLNPQMPHAASALLMRALALDPGQRPASAAAMRAVFEQKQEHAPPAPAPPRLAPSRQRGLIFAIAGAAVALLLLAALALRGSIFGNPEIAQQPTSSPPSSAPATATTIPSTNVTAAAITTPPTSAINTPTAAAPAATATPPDPTAPRPPTPQVSSVEPQSAFAGTLPLVLTVCGAALGQVRAARLVADGKAPIDTTLQTVGAGQLALSVAALPEPINGAVSYRLELDGVILESPAIILRDFIERKTVQGIQPRYNYTGRVASDEAGAYTRMRVEPNVESQPGGQLRNGDEVEILRDDMADWYQVRVRSSGDPALIGTTGWIERWLVDNEGVPPTPALQVFVGRVYSAPTDAAVQCGTAFDSSIYGSVENTNGRGIGGAQIRITSADGHNSYTVTTSRSGVYSVPGLGCTTWTVRLISVPNAPGGLQANPVTVRNLNGGRFTSAEVRFKLQQ